MRGRNAIFAAVLIVTPLSARGADLVVWWEEGYYAEEKEAVRELIAAFEAKSGKQIALVVHPPAEQPEAVRTAIDAGLPPDFCLASGSITGSSGGHLRVSLWTSPTPSGRTCLTPTRSITQGYSREARADGAFMRCRWGALPSTCTSGRACSSAQD